MTEWKYGTILHRPSEGTTYAMVVGRNNSPRRIATSDDHSGVSEGQWLGLTLKVNDYAPSDGKGPWGEPGDTTWLLDDDWEVVSE